MKEDRRAKLSDLFKEISELYGTLVNEFPEFGTVKLSQTLEEEEKYFTSAQGFYKIAVVGSYSTGKTTLLKALFFDRGIYNVDLPTAADITTQVPTIIKLIPGYNEENCYVRADPITTADFIQALRWNIDQMSQKVALEKPNFNDLTPTSFATWVNEVALPALKQPIRGGTGATQDHYILELKEAVQIFRTLDPGYKLPPINSIKSALDAIKDGKASRTLRSISISIPAQNITYPIQLVDLPGMDVPNLAHRQFSYKFIAEEADAVLFLKDSQKPSFTEGEQELLTHIASKLYDIQQKCFFIFNKWHDTDHPGAERAVREVINEYHFQSKNVFRVSSLPALMYLEEKSGIDIDAKYRKNQQEWAISNYRDLKQQYGNRLLSEMGVLQLREFLEYYCENSLPMLAMKNHGEVLMDFLKAMNKRVEEIIVDPKTGKIDTTIFEDSELSRCKAALEGFKENVHGVEKRLDEFADSLQQSIEKLIETTHGKVDIFSEENEEQKPKGKLGRLLEKLFMRRRMNKAIRATKSAKLFEPKLEIKPEPKKTPKELDVPAGKDNKKKPIDDTVIFDEADAAGEIDLIDNEPNSPMTPQRPVDILTYLTKEIFPTIDVYQRVRVIRNYTAGRSKVLSHEIELAVIKDVNKSLREKFLEVLIGIVAHHIEALCRTIDNEGYIDHIEEILTQFNLNLYIQPHTLFIKFMDSLKGQLNEACGVMAEIAIKKLDEVGIYNENLNYVASIECDNQEQCRQKQEALIEYLTENYKKHVAIAFQTLCNEGWDELSEKIAKGREKLVGLLGRHDVIASKIFDERKAMERRGISYDRAMFEQIEDSLKEKFAVIKDVAKEDLEVKVTQRNAKITEYQQKIQIVSHQAKELMSLTPAPVLGSGNND